MNNNLRKVMIICGLLLPLIVQAQGKRFTLNVKLDKVPATAMAYLVYTPNEERKIDSVKLVNGMFSFKGDIEQVISGYLLLSPEGDGMRGKNYSSLQLYLEPGNIQVNGLVSLTGARVKAGQVNADNDLVNLQLKPIIEKERKLRSAFQTALNGEKEEIERQLAACEAQRKQIYQDFITANPDHLMSFFALKAKAGAVAKAEELEPYFNKLSPQIRNSKPGLAYAVYLTGLKAVAMGAAAPEFVMPDTSGKRVSLKEYRGKYVLIDFWASWCKPCREENPNLFKAYQAYKDKGLVIIGVSLDYPGGRKAWTEAIKKDQMEWVQVSELQGWSGKTGKAYFIKAIPQNFLLDPDGKIVAKDLRGEVLQEKLKEIYN